MKPLALILAAAPALASACPPSAADGRLLAGDGVQAAWRVEGGALPLAQPFAILVRACPPQAELVAVDASMPAHRHGMNYRPSLHALGDGRWRVEGLLFHMPGAWELRLDLRLGGRVQALRAPVDLR